MSRAPQPASCVQHASAVTPLRRLSLLLLLLGACGRERVPVEAVAAASPAPDGTALADSAAAQPADPTAFVLPYPRAAWRLATTAELSDTVLWFSQILIRHADARNEVAFNIASWTSALPPATRSRAEALELAERLAAQAARNPEGFAALAREHSEDLPRRDEGGAMGGVQASQIYVWPQVLDTLAALAPGQSSRAVESPYGFHIFLRESPPPEAELSGSHIVIGHDQAPWLQVFGRGERPSRSREQALTLARDLAARARAEPSRFAELARKHSEHRDAIVGGDFGAWSTREPVAFAPRLKRLRELEVGEVGEPIETHLGFEIVQRTAPRPRQQLRARLLVHTRAFGSELSSSVPERELLAQANAAARQFVQHPERFELAAADAPIEQWQEGRGIPGLSLLLPGLRPGQIAPAAVASEHGTIIAQRLAAEPVVARRFATELPAPAQPDVARFLADLSAADAETFLRGLLEHLQATLALGNELSEPLRRVHELGGRIAPDTLPEVRLALYRNLLEQTRELLPAEAYARYRDELNEGVRALLLGGADTLGW